MATETTDLNRDPITGSPGSHPVGTGVGAAGGGAAGVAVGAALGGPLGALVGGALGAIAGGAAGHATAEAVDPTAEEAYWRSNYRNRSYVGDDADYDTYAPAYRYGVESRNKYRDRDWDDKLETELRSDWSTRDTDLDWDTARPAVQDSWQRSTWRLADAEHDDAYWRTNHTSRPYYSGDYDYDKDYAPAYRFGREARHRYHDRDWDDNLEAEMKQEWSEFKAESSLKWEQAKDAVRDAWNRVTGRTTAASHHDDYWRDNYSTRDYVTGEHTYDDDYRPAYRYGHEARRRYGSDREWDDKLEKDLEQGWRRVKGRSRLGWENAKHATKDAWHNVERAIPGDADRDGY
jgi:hypothetical protein